MDKKSKKIHSMICMSMLSVLLIAGTTACRNTTSAKNDKTGTQTGNEIANQLTTDESANTVDGNMTSSNVQVTDGNIDRTDGNAAIADENTNTTENFGDLLNVTDDIEELYAYIEKNAENATTEDWNEWVNGIVKFGGENADYGRLQEYRGKMSKEMQSFVELMSAEQTRPAFNEEGIQLTLAEILERCIAIEEHIQTFGKGSTYSILYPKYCQLMNVAVTGGYDGVDVVTNEYLEEDKQHIRTNVIEEYKRVIKNHPNTETADILEEYVEELRETNHAVTSKIEKFYENIYQEIDDEFS